MKDQMVCTAISSAGERGGWCEVCVFLGKLGGGDVGGVRGGGGDGMGGWEDIWVLRGMVLSLIYLPWVRFYVDIIYLVAGKIARSMSKGMRLSEYQATSQRHLAAYKSAKLA